MANIIKGNSIQHSSNSMTTNKITGMRRRLGHITLLAERRQKSIFIDCVPTAVIFRTLDTKHLEYTHICSTLATAENGKCTNISRITIKKKDGITKSMHCDIIYLMIADFFPDRFVGRISCISNDKANFFKFECLSVVSTKG